MFSSSFGKQSTPSPSPLPHVSNPYNANGDFEVTEVSEDGITTVNFSPTADILVATSWDTSIRLWEVQKQQALFGSSSPGAMQCTPKCFQKHTEPILCSAFNRDGSAVFFGGTDGKVSFSNCHKSSWHMASFSRSNCGIWGAIKFVKLLSMSMG